MLYCNIVTDIDLKTKFNVNLCYHYMMLIYICDNSDSKTKDEEAIVAKIAELMTKVE